ncbi:hypothetical protein Q4Q34_09015 [Flavivirga abyssicola]|uniref:hypothetical protein n=1 Tax=Flavivirga abyssicola TaxID=3063533 RepID=UPI0026E0095E|nr:hypothetical protein [Flavivirga sp. MEBiC07777]WVK15167.1 hypothetical protein Q4Q34_09015 [Flavivirga sp. MEBiC07777]
MKRKLFKPTVLLALFSIILGCSSSSDSCETITCLNGGVFTDCECECPEGYTGSNCSTQITPKSITITKATVKAFPIQQSNGDNWDFDLITPNNELPDVYITFQNSNLDVIYDSDTFFENILITGGNYLEFSPNLKIVNYANAFLVNIYDYDPNDADDFMASQGFVIYNEFNGFPETIEVKDVSDSILVELQLNYEF